MPGPRHALEDALAAGVSETLLQTLDLDRLHTDLREPPNRDALLGGLLGERSVGVALSDDVAPLPQAFHRLDPPGFGRDLVGTLEGSCTGYVLRVAVAGAPGLTHQSGRARTAPDGDLYWTVDARMHVASVSKLVTAMAARKALADTNTPAATEIWPYLPFYWSRGPSLDKVTFEMLLTHRSGFFNPVTDLADYGELKAQAARGALLGVPLGDATYQNVNFGMFRVLIPVLTGAVDQTLTVPGGTEDDNDRLWEALTIQGYHDYVQDNVFGPAGVTGAATAGAPGNVLAYRWPMPQGGWNSGDLSATSATTGWHVTAHELVGVLDAFTGGAMVPRKDAWAMLERGWGVDRSGRTDAGPYFLKAGRWESTTNQLEQAVAGWLPGGLPFALLVNSKVGKDSPSLVDVVASAVHAHIVPL
ncbi:beta-lactamase family protein [Phycicoccus sp. HDW14]|uniref:serine hydrolase n=1 Tax=Phycicoccus sp. HDW14 TaxID=2714941 RepID=UPI0014079B98|nr:serine hydrolase domain-containing protein [Phycicoccus sp. HDW14]QIM19945.1 beta-lactamase family protein [Phycicoccus sp. HDW14]